MAEREPLAHFESPLSYSFYFDRDLPCLPQYIRHRTVPRKSQRELKLGEHRFDHGLDAGLTSDREPVGVCPANY